MRLFGWNDFFNFDNQPFKNDFMGKGDKKTRRGKITRGSYGKTRPRKTSKLENLREVEKEEKKKLSKTERKRKTEAWTSVFYFLWRNTRFIFLRKFHREGLQGHRFVFGFHCRLRCFLEGLQGRLQIVELPQERFLKCH